MSGGLLGQRRWARWWSLTVVGLSVFVCTNPVASDEPIPRGVLHSGVGLRAGVSAVDVTPRQWPVRVNGGFLEAQADHADDPLHARCIVLESAATRIALVVVDSCMIPHEICDQAKKIAAERTGIPSDRILISATHSHSAPSVMDYCLGSRSDPAYADFLPTKIAEAIEQAAGRLEQAEVGWGAVDASEFTNCRRWITRSDKLLTDPFGVASVHANMHPGHEHPDFAGTSGPTDPELTFLCIRSVAGKPLGILANFSMHYFGGHAGLSADYCGLFARLIQERFGGGSSSFVGIMSQGTSGDLWWGDYSRPKMDRRMEEYTEALVNRVSPAMETVTYHKDPEVAMVERRITLGRRTPSQERLTWARNKVLEMGERRPKDLAEVYAEQAIYLHGHPTCQVVLQALRIGDLAITALPNEVYALTGLKLKLKSPLPLTMNIELANGADGYIPPPEQHRLGGYTTWPARTAGLEVEAEPKIVANLLEMLEQVCKKPQREFHEAFGSYAQAVLRDSPRAYYRLAEWSGDRVADASGNHQDATLHGKFAFFLPGPNSVAFAGEQTNRSIHSVEGFLEVPVSLSGEGSIELWCWNGLVAGARGTTGTLVRWSGESLEISGADDSTPGRLVFGGGKGFQIIPRYTWAHLVLTRDAREWRVYLNGQRELTRSCAPGSAPSGSIRIGGDVDDPHCFHGRLDEISFYDHALTPEQVKQHYSARL